MQIHNAITTNKWLSFIVIIPFIYICNGTTYICNDDNQCPEQMNCEENEACIIQCGSSFACRSKTIQCPSNHECEVHCINPKAQRQCEGIIINAQTSSYLFINASLGNSTLFDNPDPNTMDDSIIHCPNPYLSKQTQSPACRINCNGDDLLRGTKIYAMEGFNGVEITTSRYVRKWCYRKGTMFCTRDFSANCPIATDANPPFRCAPGTSSDFTCDDYTLTPTTPDPTAEPTTNPSFTPTLLSTLFPTWQPTLYPTVSPSMYPTSMALTTHLPTNSPTLRSVFTTTFSPTFDPTVAPTVDPTFDPIFTTSSTPTNAPPSSPQTTLNPTQSPLIHTINPTIYASKTTLDEAEYLLIDRTPLGAWISLILIGGACCCLFVFIVCRYISFEDAENANKLQQECKNKYYPKDDYFDATDYDDDDDDACAHDGDVTIITYLPVPNGAQKEGRKYHQALNRMKTKDELYAKEIIRKHDTAEVKDMEEYRNKKQKESKSDELFSQRLSNFASQQVYDEHEILKKMANNESPGSDGEVPSDSDDFQVKVSKKPGRSFLNLLRSRSKSTSQSKKQKATPPKLMILQSTSNNGHSSSKNQNDSNV